MQWGMGLIIDLSKSLGKSEIASFQISFFIYLLMLYFFLFIFYF